MIDLKQIIIKKWGYKNRDYYVNKGYTFTNWGDVFNIKAEDLPPNADDTVVAYCDYCGKEMNPKYKRYNEAIEKFGNIACQNCQQKRTLQQRQAKIFQIVSDFCDGHGYKLITKKEDITSMESKITYICPVHGEYTTTAKSIQRGCICYQCGRHNAGVKVWEHGEEQRIQNYYQIALEQCEELGYTLLSSQDEILSYKTYVRYKCPIHGEQSMRYGNLINGRRCPECSRVKSLKIKDENNGYKVASNKLGINDVINRVKVCGGIVLNPEDYINQNERNLRVTCPRCGNEFKTSLVLFTQHGGQVCQDCYRKESVGERIIRQYLESKNIKFTPEAWFSDCRDAKPLPFDFYLYNDNIIIEFDGKQHDYDGKKYFHESYDYEKQKLHDEIKTQYCIDNNIKLIRIPYWKIDKITQILDNELNYSHEDIV